MTGKLALFDWDGTLVRGFTIRRWVSFLVGQQAVEGRILVDIEERFRAYADKSISYEDLSRQTAELYARGLARSTIDLDLPKLASAFLEDEVQQLYPFAHELLSRLAALDIKNVVVSGAPDVVLTAYAARLPIHKIFGLRVSPRTGRVQANSGLLRSKRRIVSRVGTNQEIIIAVGDSTSDEPLLAAARHRFLLVHDTHPLPTKISPGTTSAKPSELLSLVWRALRAA